jgi:hypothetical protein
MGNRNKYNNGNRWDLPSKESLSTRRDWNDSEVANEFEKIVLESVAKFEYLALQHKKASGLSELANESEKTQQSIEGTTQSVERLDTALDSINSAEDDEVEEDTSEEEVKEAKASLIAELTKKAYAAADSGDMVLAYQIERAIEEIEEA